MQADKLRELRELLAKATPGPWHRRTECEDQCCWHMHTAKDGVYGSRPEDGEEDGDLINYPELSEDDSALIVAAVNALPALLALAEGAEADRADARRLDALRDNSWDLRCFDTHGGEDIAWEVIEHHGDAPHERRVSVVYADDPRAAIDAAMAGAVTQGES